MADFLIHGAFVKIVHPVGILLRDILLEAAQHASDEPVLHRHGFLELAVKAVTLVDVVLESAESTAIEVLTLSDQFTD